MISRRALFKSAGVALAALAVGHESNLGRAQAAALEAQEGDEPLADFQTEACRAQLAEAARRMQARADAGWMQRELNRLARAGGGTLFLEPRTYLIDRTITVPPGVTLVGNHVSKTRIERIDDGTALRIQIADTGGVMLDTMTVVGTVASSSRDAVVAFERVSVPRVTEISAADADILGVQMRRDEYRIESTDSTWRGVGEPF